MLLVRMYAHVKPESVADFRQATIENARASVQEPGIGRFDVVQLQNDFQHGGAGPASTASTLVS
jgi:autoinducer 2-degrading protein